MKRLGILVSRFFQAMRGHKHHKMNADEGITRRVARFTGACGGQGSRKLSLSVQAAHITLAKQLAIRRTTRFVLICNDRSNLHS